MSKEELHFILMLCCARSWSLIGTFVLETNKTKSGAGAVSMQSGLEAPGVAGPPLRCVSPHPAVTPAQAPVNIVVSDGMSRA